MQANGKSTEIIANLLQTLAAPQTSITHQVEEGEAISESQEHDKLCTSASFE